MASLICCRAQESSSRRRLENLIISVPQDFRHVSHYGDHDTEGDNIAGQMSSKCGNGVFAQKFHLECIDLAELKSSNTEAEKQEEELGNNNRISFSRELGPPKFAPPPPPTSNAYLSQ